MSSNLRGRRSSDSWRRKAVNTAFALAAVLAMIGIGFLVLSVILMISSGEYEGPLIKGVLLIVPGGCSLLIVAAGQRVSRRNLRRRLRYPPLYPRDE